jgi:hypothetical protein
MTYHSAITDSDRHYPLTSPFDTDDTTNAPVTTTAKAIDILDELIEDTAMAVEAEDEPNAMVAIPDPDHDPALPAVPPYDDPYIAPPDKPPWSKKVSFTPSIL